VDIVVKGRNVEVPDHFREHVATKLAPSERLDSRVIRIDVELMHEKNPRQSDRCQRVEITCYSKGPVIRAEASNGDFYAALDMAVLKLEARLRKAHDRRRVHHGRHTPPSVAEATAGLPGDLPPLPVARNGSSAHVDRRRAARDGARRARLLPVQRRGDRVAERRLPPSRIRLRGHPAGDRLSHARAACQDGTSRDHGDADPGHRGAGRMSWEAP
jgi:ribosomal subunit interface protein